MSTADKPPKPLPWYQEGLNFKCTECGKCCTGAPGFVWVTEAEMETLATQLNLSLAVFKRKYTRQRDNRYSLTERISPNGEHDCVFLKDRKCTVYQARPKQCRTYPWWKENLKSPESWKLAAEECEGINLQAPLIPYADIKKQMG